VQIFASQLARSERDPSPRAEEAGRLWGAQLARQQPPVTTISKEEAIDQLVGLHQQYGFRPQLRQADDGQEIVLKSCPLKDEATTYQTVICPAHLGLIRGVLTELRNGIEADWLEPLAAPGACVAHLANT
jgi:predicted ArsR family transcriptional regulator